MDAQIVKNHKEFLSSISVQSILNKVREFRALDVRQLNYEELYGKIHEVISSPQNHSILPTFLQTYPANTDYFRVRLIPKDDHLTPLKTMSFANDAWNPPSEFVTKLGRLNKEFESLLYLAPTFPNVALKEMRVKEDDLFCVIVYNGISEVKANVIGYHPSDPTYTDEENLKMQIISDFLRDEFTRDVGTGTEFLYRTSECIAKNYNDLPPRVIQDAWAYPSVLNKKNFNICFRPEVARELLTVKCVAVCRFKYDRDDILYFPLMVTDSLNNESPCIWYGEGSENYHHILRTFNF
jgi:hypothetical protein